MGLETPLALLGLLGALIPLLAHRMRNRELPRVVLPTFALLSRAAAKSQHKRALSDLLLLCVRIAVVALCTMALAAPYVSMQLRFSDGQLANAVFVIDDSLSMSRRDSGSTLIEQARARTLEALSTLPEGSEVAIVLAGKPARVLVPLSRDLASVRRSLERAALPAVRSGDMSAAVELAAREQNRGSAAPRRMLVLSDFAKHVALDPRVVPLEAAVSFERIGSETSSPNLYIASAHASADPSRPRDTSIALEVRATGAASSLPDARVQAEVDGRTVSSTALSFEHATAKTVLHVTTPEPTQSVEVKIRLVVDDALEADNLDTLVLGHADALQLLLVNGDPRPSNRGDELFYASRALELLPEDQLSLRVQSVDALGFEHVDLKASDVVVLANAPPPSPGLAQKLVEFVRGGGGLIIAAGTHVEAAPYNALLGPVLPSHIQGVGPCKQLRLALGDQPRFLPDGLAGLREARSWERLLIERNPGVETLLAFEDGLPALAARHEGEGRCLLFALSLDADFSDLPLRPGFIPLLASMIQHAAGTRASTRSHVEPGESISLPQPQPGYFLEVSAPDGRKQTFVHEANGDAPRFSGTDALGLYQVRSGKRDQGASSSSTARATFVVDPPRDESDLTPGAIPSASAPGDEQPRAAVTVHKPLSPWILLGMFALVLLDGALRMRKRWTHA